MNISSLPDELVVKLLVDAARARGLKRAMRLRLVCKDFNRLFREALFSTELLEDFHLTSHDKNFTEGVFWQPESYYEFWQSYIMYRTLSPTTNASPGAVIIRETAQSYCKLAGFDNDKNAIHKCIWALCDLRVHFSARAYFATRVVRPISPTLFRRYLLVACVCMDDTAVARHVVNTMCLPGEDDPHTCYFRSSESPRAFRCPSSLAVSLGRLEMLQLFLDLSPEHYTRCHMLGIAKDGDLETLEFITCMKRPHEFGQQELMKDTISLLWKSRDPRIFNQSFVLREQLYLKEDPNMHLNQEFDRWLADKKQVAETLEFAALKGSVELVSHLFDIGVARVIPRRKRLRILQAPAHQHRYGIVKVFLQKGAVFDRGPHGDVLDSAVKGCSLEVARLLLDSGVNVHGKKRRPIVSAVSTENLAMFNLLRERGGLTEDAWREAITVAEEAGLESMLELLKDIQDRGDGHY